MRTPAEADVTAAFEYTLRRAHHCNRLYFFLTVGGFAPATAYLQPFKHLGQLFALTTSIVFPGARLRSDDTLLLYLLHQESVATYLIFRNLVNIVLASPTMTAFPWARGEWRAYGSRVGFNFEAIVRNLVRDYRRAADNDSIGARHWALIADELEETSLRDTRDIRNAIAHGTFLADQPSHPGWDFQHFEVRKTTPPTIDLRSLKVSQGEWRDQFLRLISFRGSLWNETKRWRDALVEVSRLDFAAEREIGSGEFCAYHLENGWLGFGLKTIPEHYLETLRASHSS